MARLREASAEAPHQGGKVTDARRQEGFDALAQAAREHRRSTARADGDDDLAAIDDGGEDEAGKLRPVDDVDRDVPGARARGDHLIERAAGRRHHGAEVGEVGLTRIGECHFEAAEWAVRQQNFVGDVRACRVPAHVCAGRAQQPQLARRSRTCADQGDGAGT